MKSITKISIGILLSVVLIGALIGNALAEKSIVDDHPDLKPLVEFVGEDDLSVLDLVGFKAAKIAMKELSFSNGDKNILALTDAGYIAKIGNYTSEKALDGVMLTAGNSRGKGNLVNVHKPYNSPLWFAFFDNRSKDCVYLQVNGEMLKTYLDKEKDGKEIALREFMNLDDKKIFTKISKENIEADKLLNNPEAWQEKMVEKVFGGNEFSIITISNLWARGLSNDYLKVAELHDHICPGIMSGYLIAEYIKKKFPSSNPRMEYTVIAIPPWCKDDVFIQFFETNVGHKRMFVKGLTEEQRKKLPKEAENVANIFIKTDLKTGKGKGIVVAFNWNKPFKEAGINRTVFKSFNTYKWWWGRLKMDLVLMKYLDEPEEIVTTIKEFDVESPAEVEKLISAGVNPLVELGIMKEEKAGTQSKAEPNQETSLWIYALIGLLVIIAIGIAFYMKKNK